MATLAMLTIVLNLNTHSCLLLTLNYIAEIHFLMLTDTFYMMPWLPLPLPSFTCAAATIESGKGHQANKTVHHLETETVPIFFIFIWVPYTSGRFNSIQLQSTRRVYRSCTWSYRTVKELAEGY